MMVPTHTRINNEWTCCVDSLCPFLVPHDNNDNPRWVCRILAIQLLGSLYEYPRYGFILFYLVHIPMSSWQSRSVCADDNVTSKYREGPKCISPSSGGETSHSWIIKSHHSFIVSQTITLLLPFYSFTVKFRWLPSYYFRRVDTLIFSWSEDNA
jgi:hypothetical protein